MLFGAWFDQLNFWSFCVLIFIGMGLVRLFDADPVEKPKSAPIQEESEIYDENINLDEVIHVRRRTIVLIRNSLMRHHNSRGTDQVYQASAAAKETTEILQVLNVALSKRSKCISIG